MSLERDLFLRAVKLKSDLPQNDYFARLPVVKNILRKGGLSFGKPITFFVGENGIGKSTLIEAIAVGLGLNPEGGSFNTNFSTAETHSELYRYLALVRGCTRPRDGFFLRAESFYNVASDVDRLESEMSGMLANYGGISLHEQSHGESFLALVENRFFGKGIYILDEPEAALSPKRLMRLMVNVNRLVKEGSQFIISTHSPILMALPDSDVYEITEEGIEITPFKETEHYMITKRFLETPEQMVKVLMSDE